MGMYYEFQWPCINMPNAAGSIPLVLASPRKARSLTIFLELFNLWSHRKESEISEDRKHDGHSSHNGPSDTAA
jgi:hypothetical protein